MSRSDFFACLMIFVVIMFSSLVGFEPELQRAKIQFVGESLVNSCELSTRLLGETLTLCGKVREVFYNYDFYYSLLQDSIAAKKQMLAVLRDTLKAVTIRNDNHTVKLLKRNLGDAVLIRGLNDEFHRVVNLLLTDVFVSKISSDSLTKATTKQADRMLLLFPYIKRSYLALPGEHLYFLISYDEWDGYLPYQERIRDDVESLRKRWPNDEVSIIAAVADSISAVRLISSEIWAAACDNRYRVPASQFEKISTLQSRALRDAEKLYKNLK